jgi:hypothetical protein
LKRFVKRFTVGSDGAAHDGFQEATVVRARIRLACELVERSSTRRVDAGGNTLERRCS